MEREFNIDEVYELRAIYKDKICCESKFKKGKIYKCILYNTIVKCTKVMRKEHHMLSIVILSGNSEFSIGETIDITLKDWIEL